MREKMAGSAPGTCTASRRQRGYVVSEDDIRPRQDIFTFSAIVNLEVHESVLQFLTSEDLNGRASASYVCARYLFAISYESRFLVLCYS